VYLPERIASIGDTDGNRLVPSPENMLNAREPPIRAPPVFVLWLYEAKHYQRRVKMEKNHLSTI